MATKSVGTIRALMEMASRKYVSDTAKGERANQKFNKGAQRGFRNSNKSAGFFTSGMKRMLGVTIALAGPAALGALIKSTLKTADTIAKTADKVGFGTDALQEIRFAAKQSGVEFSATDIALQRFTRRVGEAANGQGVLAKVFKENNIRLRNQNGTMRSSSDILDDYADLIGRADNQQTKLLLTFQAFDTEGAALVNLLGEGSGEMKKLRQEARDLGLVLDEDLLRGAEDANDALDKMSSTIKAELSKRILELAPAIETLATKFIEGLPGMLDFVEGFGEFIGLIDKGEVEILGDQIDENNKKIEVSKTLLEDLKEQVLPGLEFVTPKEADKIKVLESNISILEERNSELIITLAQLNIEQERVSESEEDLTEGVDDNTESVGANTKAWIRQQDLMAIMANKAFPDISDAIDETDRRIKKLREQLDLDPFEGAVEGAEMFAQTLRVVNAISNELAAGELRRAEESEQRSIEKAENEQIRREAEIEAKAQADIQDAMNSIQGKDALAKKLIDIENAKNLALGNSEKKFESDSVNIKAKTARKEAKIRSNQKVFMIAEALANTAVGVTKALSAANIPLSILIGILGAVQVANIAATKFAIGGSGIVGGPGGTDKTFVPIMATRNEKMTVQTPAQQRAGIFPGSGAMRGPTIFNLDLAVVFEGITPEEDLQQRIIPGIEDAARQLATKIITTKNIRDGADFNGDLLRSGEG